MQPKITVQMNVYNAEDFLFYSLSSIYDFADRIVIIDGAYNEEMPTPLSTDGTEKIVKEFPDEDSKIIYLRTSAKNQIEQKNKVWPYVIGKWLFLVDHDEVYKKEELEKTREWLSGLWMGAYFVGANVFVNSFDWYYRLYYPRIFRTGKRLKENLRFVKPNFFKWSTGQYEHARRKPPDNAIKAEAKNAPFIHEAPPLTMYHYSWVGNAERFRIKEAQRHLVVRWVDSTGRKRVWRNSLHAKCENGLWIVPKAWGLKKFEGEHPEIMKNHPFRNLNKDWKPTKFLED